MNFLARDQSEQGSRDQARTAVTCILAPSSASSSVLTAEIKFYSTGHHSYRFLYTTLKSSPCLCPSRLIRGVSSQDQDGRR